jgi:hypothetical protein
MADAVQTAPIIIKTDLELRREWDGGIVGHAVIEATPAFVARVKQLQAALLALKVTSIEEYDCTPDYVFSGDDHSLRGDRLVVTDTEFWWQGYEKHSDSPWETTMVSISVLDSEPGTVHDQRTETDDEDAPEGEPETEVQP